MSEQTTDEQAAADFEADLTALADAFAAALEMMREVVEEEQYERERGDTGKR